MQLTLRKPNVSLEAGEVLTLQDAAGTSIVTRTGTVWVTEEGSIEDRIIGPGETVVISHAGMTVVQALKNASKNATAAIQDYNTKLGVG